MQPVDVLAGLWVVQFGNAASDYRAVRFGLAPHRIAGLRGLVTEPFLSTGYGELALTTVPFAVLSWYVLKGGIRTWSVVPVAIVLFGGALTWMFGPTDRVYVGLDALVFGYFAYFLALALFARQRRQLGWLLAALGAFAVASGGVLPGLSAAMSWQPKVAALNAGLAVLNS